MNEIKNGQFVSEAALADRTALCDLNDEFTLPDYMPPIGRVVAVEGIAAPPSRYIGGGNVEYAGAVRYRLTYEAIPDGESREAIGSSAPCGELWCAELVSEYDTLIPLEKSAADGGALPDLSGCVSVAFAEVENVTARVTAPRRAYLRSRVRVRARVQAPLANGCLVRGDAPETGIRTLTAPLRCGATVVGASEPISLHDTVPAEEIAAHGKGDVRVVGCRGRIFVADAVLSPEGVSCRGEAAIELLLCCDGEGERPFSLTRRIPLAAEIPLDSDFPEEYAPMGACAWGRCTSVNAAVEDGTLVCEAECRLYADAAASGGAEYLRDIYSCDCNSEVAMREVRVFRPVFCGNANISVSGGTENGGRAVRISDVSAAVIPESLSAGCDEDGRIFVSGKLRASVVTDDGASFAGREFDLPFRYTGVQTERGSEIRCDADVSVAGCRARTEGDRIVCDCELAIALRSDAQCRVSTVGEVNFTSPRKREGGAADYVVCYPAADDTLWSVSRRYGADTAAVARRNGLDASCPEAPLGGADKKFLIIS